MVAWCRNYIYRLWLDSALGRGRGSLIRDEFSGKGVFLCGAPSLGRRGFPGVCARLGAMLDAAARGMPFSCDEGVAATKLVARQITKITSLAAERARVEGTLLRCRRRPHQGGLSPASPARGLRSRFAPLRMTKLFL